MHIDLTRGFEGGAVVGSKTQDEWMKLKGLKRSTDNLLSPLNEKYGALVRESKIKSKAGVTDSLLLAQTGSIRKKMAPFEEKLKEIDRSYFKKYPHSYITAYELRYHLTTSTVSELSAHYNEMSKQVKESRFGTYLKSQIDYLARGSVGSTATDFVAKSVTGDILRLSQYRGKYVLLDFWASWCAPCRAGNRELINLYSLYKNKGIEFVGISDDDLEEAKWRNAIQKDRIGIWQHVLRGLGKDPGDNKNEINSFYGIRILPTKILIDPTGIIISRYGD